MKSSSRLRAPNAALITLVTSAIVSCAISADARHVRPLEQFQRGLTPQASGDARGIIALRTPRTTRVYLPPGHFQMGSTALDMQHAIRMCSHEVLGTHCEDPGVAAAFRAELVAHDVTLPGFFLDRTEVTVSAYARCVSAGTCAPAGFVPGDPRFDRPELPVVFVRWSDASAYCTWAHGRLPTEAEWEYAARGRESREFPWGNVYNPHLANHGSFADDSSDATDGFADLAPVGSFHDGATPLGIEDLAGNAAEWVNDFFDLDANGFGYAPDPAYAPKGPQTGGFHAVRGGSYLDGAAWIRGASRAVLWMARSPEIGFRCAYDDTP